MELWHSAPGLLDAGLILKKLPPVGKRKFNQAFLGGEKAKKAWQEEEEEEVEVEVEVEEEVEEKADVDKGVESNREMQMRKK